MNVSPLDLRQQQFGKSLRGFDPVEVTSFLLAVADDYEQALRETSQLKQEVGQLQATVTEHRLTEKSLHATLMTAQKLADDIKANAEEEAGRIVREAQERSDMVLERSRARLEEVQRDIDGLRLKRRDVEASLESTIQALRNTLDFIREQDNRDRDDKVLLHRPRAEPTSAATTEPELAAAAGAARRT